MEGGRKYKQKSHPYHHIPGYNGVMQFVAYGIQLKIHLFDFYNYSFSFQITITFFVYVLRNLIHIHIILTFSWKSSLISRKIWTKNAEIITYDLFLSVAPLDQIYPNSKSLSPPCFFKNLIYKISEFKIMIICWNILYL